MGRQLAPLFFAAFLAYGYNNIFMTLTPSFVVAAGGTLAEAGPSEQRVSGRGSPLALRLRPGGGSVGHEAGHARGLRRLCSGASVSRCVPSSGRMLLVRACRRSALLLSGRRPQPPFRRRRRPRRGAAGSACIA